MSKIQKESNSQRHFVTFREQVGCCDICQRYKKKAIHNHTPFLPPGWSAVAIYVKDTKRKQFTTCGPWNAWAHQLLRYMSKIQKESNSQQRASDTLTSAGCCDICQRYKKKAIHNSKSYMPLGSNAVAIYVKDTKRKQFTTARSSHSRTPPLLRYMSKIQKKQYRPPMKAVLFYWFGLVATFAKFAQLFKVGRSWIKFGKVGFTLILLPFIGQKPAKRFVIISGNR